ncbi:MAG: NAD(P)/FAD-dependent oxidoreductase [Maricaulaceae bacterium]|jgi:flavin-dependent dehydrogenase
MSEPFDTDLLIVGGGFAGLEAGAAAARAGARVLVVEAKRAIGARLHTTGIFVKEAHDLLDIPAALCRKVHKVRLYGPSRKSVDLTARGSYFLTTDTRGVLTWMAERARKDGVTIWEKARFEGAAQDAEGVTAQIGGRSVRARFILGADGARSRVAQAFGLGANTRMLTGLEREYPLPEDLDPDYLYCFLDSRSAPGYLAWAAPAPNFLQVGLAVAHGRRPKLQPFADEVADRFELDDSHVMERRAGVIPCGGLVAHWQEGRAMLVGDAAGMVSPLTGGGIKLAIEQGRHFGAAIAAHLVQDGPPPAAVLEPGLPRFAVKSLLRAGLDIAPANPILDAALSTGAFRAFARRVYFSRDGSGQSAHAA